MLFWHEEQQKSRFFGLMVYGWYTCHFHFAKGRFPFFSPYIMGYLSIVVFTPWGDAPHTCFPEGSSGAAVSSADLA